MLASTTYSMTSPEKFRGPYVSETTSKRPPTTEKIMMDAQKEANKTGQSLEVQIGGHNLRIYPVKKERGHKVNHTDIVKFNIL